MSTDTVPTAAATWEAFRWQNRVVVSFLSEAELPEARKQREYQTTAQREWRDRDLVLVEVGPGNEVLVNHQPHPSIDGARLRERFTADADKYVAILVGKDGYEKLRSETAIANETLFPVIDAMPMRQREMRRD